MRLFTATGLACAVAPAETCWLHSISRLTRHASLISRARLVELGGIWDVHCMLFFRLKEGWDEPGPNLFDAPYQLRR